MALVIGLTGPNAAGKGEVANHLDARGFRCRAGQYGRDANAGGSTDGLQIPLVVRVSKLGTQNLRFVAECGAGSGL